MRLVTEIALFLLIFAIAVVLCASVIWCVGAPLQIKMADSVFLSFISLAILLPSIGNFWIMFRGSDGETLAERTFAGLRGFGMLICALILFAGIASKSVPFRAGFPLFLLGSVLWWGTLPLELWLRHRKQSQLFPNRDV